MKIAVQAKAADARVIRELLSPWNVSFTSLDKAEVVIAYKEKPLETKKTIVIPSDSADFMTWIKNLKSKVVRKPGEPVSAVVSPQAVLTIVPQTSYCYDGSIKSVSKNASPTTAKLNDELIFLTLDIVREYNKILDDTFNAKPSAVYRLMTGLPVPYSLAPKNLRDFFMKKRRGTMSLTFCDKLPLDALRFILVGALENFSRKEIERKTWNGKRYAFVVTHDVDTQEGLQRAKKLRKIENKYDVPSVWYIPSKRYKLNAETIKELANCGEVGAHGTRHDGRLNRLHRNGLIKRLHEAKEILEKITGKKVNGFRAPLLQHSVKIIEAVRDVGYTYDASIPTQEPRHPYTMNSHGIGTTYPLTIEGIVEIPVTLPQDQQLLHVLGLSPEEVTKQWMSMIEIVKEIGGLCTILIHPDFEWTDPKNAGLYEEILMNPKFGNAGLIGLPTNITTWVKSHAA